MKKRLQFSSVSDKIVFVAVPVLILIFWQILGNAGFLNAIIIPTPKKIVNAFVELISSGKFSNDFKASFSRVILGFLWGTFAGIIMGILTGLFSKVNSGTAFIFGILRPIPMIGLVPLMILWFGIGETSKVIVIAIGTFWSVLINTQAGIEQTDKKLIEVAAMLEKNKFAILRQIVFPSALPSVFTGIRLGLGNAWKSVVAAEMLAATKGIGHMIEYARELAQPSKMFVGILTIGIVGFLLDKFLLILQKKIISWS